MKRLSWLVMLLLALSCAPLAAAVTYDYGQNARGLSDTTLLIIRHAEKSARGAGLAPVGEARSEAYVHYFQSFTNDGRPLHPDMLIATADTKHSMRESLTLMPLAKALGLPINSRFKNMQIKALTRTLRAGSHGATVLICWHHGQIPNLIDSLGGDASALLPNGKWPKDVYGWVVVLRYDHNGQLTSARVVHEHLMPDDH